MTETNNIKDKGGLETALQAKNTLAQATKEALLAAADGLTDATAKTKYFSYLNRLLLVGAFARPKLGGVDLPLTTSFGEKGIGISHEGRKIGFLRGEKMTDGNHQFNYYYGSPHFTDKVAVADLTKWEEAIKTNSTPELLSAFLTTKLPSNFNASASTITANGATYSVTIHNESLSIYPYGHPNIKLEINLSQESPILKDIDKQGMAGLTAELAKLKNQLPAGVSTTPTYASRSRRYSRHSSGRPVVHRSPLGLDDLLPPVDAPAPAKKPPQADRAAASATFAEQTDVLSVRPLRPLAPSQLIPLGREPEVKIELTRPYRPSDRPARVETPLPAPTAPARPAPPLKPIVAAENAEDMYLDIFDKGLLAEKTLGARRILDFKRERPEDAEWDYAYRSLITYLASFGHRETLSGAMKEARHYRCLITKNHDLFFYRSLDERRVMCHLYRQNQARHRDELPLTVSFALNVPELAANMAAAVKTRSAEEMRQKNGKKLHR